MEKFKMIVRALLALVVIGTACFLAYTGKLAVEAFAAIAMYVIQFYFNGDNTKKEDTKEEKKNENTG